MPDARINGVRIWYKETGQGDPVMQIHGAGFGHFNFATATPILSKSLPVHRLRYARLWSVRATNSAIQHGSLGRRRRRADGSSRPKRRSHPRYLHGRNGGAAVRGQYPDRTKRLVINCSAAKLDYAGILTFRGWIDIAEGFGMGSRTLAELVAIQALSRRFLDGPTGPGAVAMIQDILQKCNRVDIFKLACQAMIDMDLRPLLRRITAPTLVISAATKTR